MASKSVLGKGLALTFSCLGALYVAACGGSASFHGETGGAAGTMAAAGSTGVGGSLGTAGTGSFAGSAGVCQVACPGIACEPGFISIPDGCCSTCVPAVGGDGGSGVGGCGAVACPDIGCVLGTTPIIEPGQCCPSCVPNGGAGGTDGGTGGTGGCGAVECPALDCVQGYTLITEPDACCPTCVPDSQACTAGEQGYQTLRASLLNQPGVTSCKVDQDCATLSGVGQCGDACAATAVNASEEPSMASQLELWSKNYCSTCMPVYPPCVAPPTPFCEGGQCQLYRPL
ncbi:MAG TPA: hypothetical protein VHV51_22895 [Polyangiaceae bacterium]|jgi:hypothetical protein|nr:hypothetical protein [Polyangiaceae bacterium]